MLWRSVVRSFSVLSRLLFVQTKKVNQARLQRAGSKAGYYATSAKLVDLKQETADKRARKRPPPTLHFLLGRLGSESTWRVLRSRRRRRRRDGMGSTEEGPKGSERLLCT